MFKEKYLIFKEGEPKLQSAEQPRKRSERKEYSSDTAEDLLSEKSVEEGVEEVMDELYELFTKGDIPAFKRFCEGNQNIGFVENLLSDKVKNYISEKIKNEFEFAGYGHGGITLLWWSPEKEMMTEINPAFLDKKVYDLLNEDTKKLITKAKLEILEKKFQRDIKPIFEGLVAQNILPQTFTFKRFIESDFSRDLRDIIKTNYDSRSTAYIWEITAKGVRFTPSEEMQTKGFKVIELKKDDYDSNLNYKKNTPKYDVQEAREEDEVIDEDEISEEQEYSEELQACEDDLDLIASGDERLEKLHFEEFKPYMEEVEAFIQNGIDHGLTPLEIKDQISEKFDEKRGIMIGKLENFASSDSYEDEYDGNTDSGSEQLGEDYGNKVEKWGAVLYQKYNLPLSNYTSSDSEEFEEGSYEDDGLGEEFFKEEKD